MKTKLLTLTIAGMASLPMLNSAYGAAIAYSETWSSTGSQATTDGTFADYSEWIYSESNDASAANARVDSAGTLTLADSFTSSNTLGAYVTPTSIGAGSTFDVSTFSLTLSADVARGFNGGTSTTYNNVGVFIGDIAFLIHPGSTGGFHRVNTINADLTQAATLQANTNIGFSPGIDGAVSDTGFSRFEITLSEKSATEYTFTYSITDLVDGNVYNNTIDVLKTDVGALDRAGVRFDNASNSSDGLFQNFSITQVPEPSTALLSAIGAIVLFRRRR